MSLPAKYIEIKAKHALGRGASAPVTVHLELLVGCNMKCKTCDQWRRYSDNPDYKKTELTTDEWIKLADELGAMGVNAVGITGGEPLLHPGLFEIIKSLKRNKIITHVNTNGTLNSDENVRRLVESGVDSVTVSIDHLGEEHDKTRGVPGTYSRAVEMVKKLKAAGIKRVGIGALLMGQETAQIENLAKLAEELGVEISFGGFDLGLLKQDVAEKKTAYQKFAENIDTVLKLRKTHKSIIVLPDYLQYMRRQLEKEETIKWCYAGFGVCIVRSNGDVQPCYQFPSAGNLHNKSFKEIWNSAEMRELRKRIKGGCKGCFANCTIEPSIILNDPFAAFNFYRFKLSKIKK